MISTKIYHKIFIRKNGKTEKIRKIEKTHWDIRNSWITRRACTSDAKTWI